jgi:hypothetical protein
LFDRDYSIRFGLFCLLAISLIVLAWTFRFKSDVVLSLNESNEERFIEKFEELKLESEWGDYHETRLEDMRQKQIVLEKIDREKYGIDPRIFTRLPLVPHDWEKIKYAFDRGMYHILAAADEDYYLQPEFYNDWKTMGLGFFRDPRKVCKAGFFSAPTGQRIYTKSGATIETFMLVHSSFCVGNFQAFKLGVFYPSSGITDDGIEYNQNIDVVKRFIGVDFDPGEILLSGPYPQFDPDWVKKVSVKISVKDDAPRGLYVVAVGAMYHRPFWGSREDVNYDAYKAKGGTPLMYLLIAVD